MKESRKIFFVFLSVATILQGLPLDDEDDQELPGPVPSESPNTGTQPAIISAPARNFDDATITDYFTVVQEAGEATNDVCDFSACNGRVLQGEINGTSYTIGECQSPIYGKQYECYVNEDSVCPKTQSEYPGQFTSAKPCEDPRAPTPRRSSSSSCCRKVEVDYYKKNAAYDRHKKRFQYYYRVSGDTIFGKPHYSSDDGKYAIWYTAKDKWVVGTDSGRGENGGFFYENSESSCPHDPAWSWKFLNFRSEWQDANKGMSIYCRD